VTILRNLQPQEQVRVSAAERGDWSEWIAGRSRSGSGSASVVDVPRAKAPLRGIRVTQDGRIWIQLSQPAVLNRNVVASTPASANSPLSSSPSARWIEPIDFDIVEPSGRYVGRVRLPDNLKYWIAQGDTVWGVTRNADDVPVVKRFQVRW
jgi:hypothetical protein